jgi:hypothetical protein
MGWLGAMKLGIAIQKPLLSFRFPLSMFQDVIDDEGDQKVPVKPTERL